MKVIKTKIADVILLEPKVFSDERGFFLESYSKRVLAESAGVDRDFVQDNHSRSAKGVLRGLHYQIHRAQGKLVRVVQGSVFDVAVDLRRSSPTFGQWMAFELSAENKLIAWIPEGFAHGFITLSDYAECVYKASDYYSPEHERCIAWNDPDLNIRWPSNMPVRLSPKDAKGKPFREAEVFD